VVVSVVFCYAVATNKYLLCLLGSSKVAFVYAVATGKFLLCLLESSKVVFIYAVAINKHKRPSYQVRQLNQAGDLCVASFLNCVRSENQPVVWTRPLAHQCQVLLARQKKIRFTA
jgi:hypothetical protein